VRYTWCGLHIRQADGWVIVVMQRLHSVQRASSQRDKDVCVHGGGGGAEFSSGRIDLVQLLSVISRALQLED
jgi:hypothetical protein